VTMKAAHYTKANITSDGTARLANARLSFYCRATHAGAVLATAPCLSVCHKSVFYRYVWTDQAGFGTEDSFDITSYGRSVVLTTGPLSLLPRARTHIQQTHIQRSRQ